MSPRSVVFCKSMFVCKKKKKKKKKNVIIGKSVLKMADIDNRKNA